MVNNKKVLKTKTKGIFLDTKTNKYLIQTTFTTKDGFRKKVCLRGFESERKALEKKMQLFTEFQNTYGNNINSSSIELLLEEYLKYKSKKNKVSSLYNDKKTIEKFLLPIIKTTDDFTIPKLNQLYENIYSSDCKIRAKNMYTSRIINFIEYLELFEKIDYHCSKKAQQILVYSNENEKPKNDYLELEEYKKFINTFDEKDKLLKLFFQTLFFTGARKMEALALRFKDINFNDGTIFFHNTLTQKNIIEDMEIKVANCIKADSYYLMPYTKTNSTKTITIPDWLLNEFKELFTSENANSDDFVFKKNGKLFTLYMLRKECNKHLKEANLKEIKIHDFRHSHTTMLYDLGCDGKYVAERLGHSNEKTSKQTYQHLTESRKKINDEKIMGLKI